MGRSGESDGARVQGVLKIEWSERSGCFRISSSWFVVDARGQGLEVLQLDVAKNVPDDEFAERTLARAVRRLAGETRAFHEERRDGVTRLL